MYLQFNGRWSAYLVENNVKVGPFFFKDGIEAVTGTADELGIGIAIGFKMVAKVEAPEPDGQMSGFRVQLKTTARTFECLEDAMAYRDRYGSPDSPLTEVLL